MAVVEWQMAGHQVEVLRMFGAGPDRLLVSGHAESPAASDRASGTVRNHHFEV
jgi:hypothetical protein